MKKTLLRALVAAGALFLASGAAARADETTYCNAYITTLPYTVTTQGHYCFDRNLSTGMTTGAAITINADYVVLDLNNFKLGGGSAGLTTRTRGVYALNRRNITIRNGNIRGFHTGIFLEENGGTSLNHVVEQNALDGHTAIGMLVEGAGTVIRRNVVSEIGGDPAPAFAYNWGILAGDGPIVVEDNKVINVRRGTTSGARGIQMDAAEGIALRNVVRFAGTDTPTSGIQALACTDNVVVHADSTYEGTCLYGTGNTVVP